VPDPIASRSAARARRVRAVRAAAFVAALAAACLSSAPVPAASPLTGGFPRLDTGARGTALSGQLTALAEGSEAIHWNAAGLLSLERREVSFTYADLFGLGLVTHSAAQFAWPQTRKQTRWEAGTIRRVPLPPPAERAFGVIVSGLRGELGAEDYYLELQGGLAYAWRMPGSGRAGAVYRYLNARSDLDGAAGSGHTLDLGLLRPIGPFTLGASVANAVSVTRWRSGAAERPGTDLDEPLAQRWSLGLAWHAPRPGLTLTVQGDWAGLPPEAVQAGAAAEWSPLRPLALRGGYRHRSDALGGRDEWSGGLGVRAGEFRVDYGWQSSGHDLGATHRWTAGLAL